MKTKRKLNVRLLRRIQKHILEEPRRFFMDRWFVKVKTKGEWYDETAFLADASSSPPPCGTAACIAGTANLLTGGRQLNAVHRAAKLLGVERFNGLGHPLFTREDWPQPFRSKYAQAKTPKTRAKIACARIDWLIKTGE